MPVATAGDVSRLLDLIAELQAKQRVLRQSLQVYADESNWTDMDNGDDNFARLWFAGNQEDASPQEHGFLLAQKALKDTR